MQISWRLKCLYVAKIRRKPHTDTIYGSGSNDLIRHSSDILAGLLGRCQFAENKTNSTQEVRIAARDGICNDYRRSSNSAGFRDEQGFG